jgi:hypothetical protein
MLRNLLVLTLGLLFVFISDPALAKDKTAKHLKDLSCAVNEIARFNGIEWQCSLDENSDTLGSLSCNTNKIAEYNGSQWVCSDKPDSGLQGPKGADGLLVGPDPHGSSLADPTIYTIEVTAQSETAGASPIATAQCDDVNDVLMASGCLIGCAGGGGCERTGELPFMSSDFQDGIECTINLNTNALSQITARAICLRVPNPAP